MKKIKIVMTIVCVMVVALGMASSAGALTITPDSGVLNVSRWEGNIPPNPDADAIEGIVGYAELTQLYKYDDYTDSITYDAPWSPIYLLVKDGVGHTPAWYVFLLRDLAYPDNDLDWDGYEDITLANFWDQVPDVQGTISHVSMYGPTGVPEPMTLILLGLGLIGLAGFRRK